MQDGGNLDFPKKRVGSHINTSLQKTNSCKNPHIRRWKPKPRSHVKTIASFLSKRKTSELSSNRARNKRLNGKPFRRRTSQKVNDTSPSERPLSSMLKDLKSLSNKCRGREKTTDKGLGSQKSHQRIRSKKRKNGELDEAARVQRRTRYLLIKMKLEQNLIEAYSGEGWKGQSREKIKPEKELQRAKKQILKCKLGIRDAIRQLESLSSEGCIEDSVIGSDGSVFHEHIFCSKCKLQEAFPDNDIILCDGACNCAFHQKCLEPPLATENIPPGDQGWYCKFCECKMAILDGINAHLGTQFSLDSKWQKIFLEAANARDNEDISIHPDGDWPSDDSDDVDFDPESYEINCSYSRMGSEENMSDDASSSGSLYWTSEEDDGLHSGQFRTDGSLEGGFYGDKTKIQSFDQTYGVDTVDSIDSNDSTDGMAYRGRQRRDVDYKKLHDEMFGSKDLPESEEISEDEDWGPRRRKRRRNESNAATTLVSSCGTENGLSNASLKKDEKKFPSFPGYKRTLFRIPPDAVKKLRAVFAETELPSRVVRESLSKQLGIAIEKINKWFKNARYTALKIRKAEKTEQSISTTGVTKQLSTGGGKMQSADLLTSTENHYLVSTGTAVQRSKLLRLHKSKNLKMTTTPLRKVQEKGSAGAPSATANEVIKAVSLKKQMGSVKRNSVPAKRIKRTCSNKEQQLYMMELERICCLEEKLEKMKKVLLSIDNNKDNVSDRPHTNEQSVVYIPVAELREKIKH